MTTLHFKQIPRRSRAKGLVPKIRRCSKRFRNAVAAGDEKKLNAASEDAWNAMTKLFEILRGEQDDGYLAATLMNVDTALLADDISMADQQKMLSMKRIDRSRSTTLSLRNTLNKIAHYKTATYRVDGRNAHYLVLGGVYRNKHWVAEILISNLCRNAAAAVQGITG